MWNTYGSGYGMMGYHSPFLSVWGPIIGIWALVAIALKGYALWNAAKRNEMWWFIALLVINTLGILELIYIIFVLKKLTGMSQPTDTGEKHDHHHDHPHHDHHHHDHSDTSGPAA
jgi:ABC-type nickel/cobalt efflux system permease component RcnA